MYTEELSLKDKLKIIPFKSIGDNYPFIDKKEFSDIINDVTLKLEDVDLNIDGNTIIRKNVYKNHSYGFEYELVPNKLLINQRINENTFRLKSFRERIKTHLRIRNEKLREQHGLSFITLYPSRKYDLRSRYETHNIKTFNVSVADEVFNSDWVELRGVCDGFCQMNQKVTLVAHINKDIPNLIISWVNITKSKFENAVVTSPFCDGVNFNNTVFENCNLTLQCRWCKFTNCIFINSNVHFKYIRGTKIKGCKFIDSPLTFSNIDVHSYLDGKRL